MGIAIGMASFSAPLYISEVSPPDMRGSLVGLNQIALVTGIVVAYLVDYALAGSDSWRWMLGLAAIPGAVLGVGMLFMPPAPAGSWPRGGRTRRAVCLTGSAVRRTWSLN